MDISSERAKKILSAIVLDFIRTAEPVSSKAIATRYSFGLSPATIRSIMAELEKEGYLIQPHTSAGRIPTDKSFRFYVDSLRELEEPPQVDKDLLKKSCEEPLAIDNILTETAKALSTLTSCAGLMLVPKKDSFIIKQINFIPMEKTSLMVVIVSRLGLVQTRHIRMETEVKKLGLEKITNYLNSIAEGLTIRELRARIIEEMRNVKNLYDELLSNALRLGAMALEQNKSAADELYVEGKANILGQPEFKDDLERMRLLFAAFEEKSLLLKILDKSMEESGIHIYLGSESMVKEFEGLSFVTAPYGRSGEVLGTLGVVGPVRMNYSRIIPIVDYTAGLLSKNF
ncbi:MAG: heat-inducible transcription repressor HrcA [Deltaproteobacteria bacterium]|nr:heat-inducible transcription repressor HrcA [Deltaproteobacteria bacterium]